MLQALTVVMLWLPDVYTVRATTAFSFLLAANVIVFAIVSHVYRTAK